jgi:multimeric flavodoxin WrbA
MVRVVGVYGSPRKGGNSDLLLDSALRGAQATEAEVGKVYVRNLNISGCLECGGCEETGTCVVKDDMQDIYVLLDEADAIILSSPIFFYGLTSQLKALVDRAQALWCRKKIRQADKDERSTSRGRGYLIAVGATRGKNLFMGVELIARYFFDALDKEYGGDLFFEGIESKGAVKAHPTMLQKAYALGEKL